MKKIYSYILIAIAFLVFAPSISVKAQTETEYKNGLGYSKKISTPDDKGIYTITLEAFTTGKVEVEKKSIPADIVLVLDVSGSMAYPMTYTARGSQAYSYNSYGDNSYYYLHTDGEYYEVSRDGRRLRFQVGDTYYYLYGTGVQTTRPNQVNNNNSTIWTGVLYEVTSSRLDALQDAVNSFIDIINENDLKDPEGNNREQRLGNRIAIVTYSTNANNATNGLIPLGNSLTDNSGVTSLKTIVNGLTANGGTYAHKGMDIAYGILSPLNDTRQLRTTVFFTDGVPGLWGSWTECNKQTFLQQFSEKLISAVFGKEDSAFWLDFLLLCQ